MCTPIRSAQLVRLAASTITVAIAPGPDKSGKPMGMSPTSSFVAASCRSSLVERVLRTARRAPCRARRAKRRMPPATLNAGHRDPEEREDDEPARANAVSTMKQVSEARSAVALARLDWLAAGEREEIGTRGERVDDRKERSEADEARA